jgi:hypothetical protein
MAHLDQWSDLLDHVIIDANGLIIWEIVVSYVIDANGLIIWEIVVSYVIDANGFIY